MRRRPATGTPGSARRWPTGGRVLTPYWGFKGRQWEKVAPYSSRLKRRGGSKRGA
jgi:hypothetical protein